MIKYKQVIIMNALIVYNPFSRKNKIEKYKNYIINSLKQKYETIDFYKTHGVRSITEYVSENINKYDLLIVSGGDGTINEAICGVLMAKSKVCIHIIPSGTVNDFAHLMGYKKSIKNSLKQILNNTSALMDVCKINDRYFTYAAAAGKYTDVSYTTPRGLKKVFGPLAYLVHASKLFFKKRKMELEITTNGTKFKGTYYVIFLLNTKRVAGFMVNKTNTFKLNDGLIELVLISKAKITWPRLAKFFLLGNLSKKGITAISTNNVKIVSKESLAINTDGELAFNDTEINISVLSKAVNFSISQKTKDKYFI